MTRKRDVYRPYPPDLVSLETLAYRLDLSPSTVQDYVTAGILPPAQKFGSSTRWEWSDVLAAIKARAMAEGEDDLITDIRKAKAARDRAS